MSGFDDLGAGVRRQDADRLFQETAARQRCRGDGRMITWFNAPEPGSRAERIGSTVSTAFATFCIVGGLSMMLGMAFLPALGVSLAVFAMIRVFMGMA